MFALKYENDKYSRLSYRLQNLNAYDIIEIW